MNLRLSVDEAERNVIRRAAALAGYRSMAAFCRDVVLNAARRIDDPNVATDVAKEIDASDPPHHDAKNT